MVFGLKGSGFIIRTLRGVKGEGVGDYTSSFDLIKSSLWVLRPLPPSPYPPGGPYEFGLRGSQATDYRA